MDDQQPMANLTPLTFSARKGWIADWGDGEIYGVLRFIFAPEIVADLLIADCIG